MATPYEERIIRLRQLLVKEGLDATIILDRVNTYYFTGFRCSYSILVVDQRSAWFVTDSRYGEMAEKSLPWLKVLVQPSSHVLPYLKGVFHQKGYTSAGIEGSMSLEQFEVVKKWTRGVKLSRAGQLITNLRRVKDAVELKAIRKAVRLADELMARAMEQIKPGLKEEELSRFIRRGAEDFGGEGESFDNIVASGPNSSQPHHHCGRRKMRVGDPVTIDLGVIANGYCSDLTRNPVLGKVSKKFEEIYQICLDANMAAIEALRPGMTGVQVDAVARNVITEAGFGDFFGHGLGHGVGLEVHEGPRLSPSAGDYQLEPGNIVTIEPGIYLPGVGGVRIEDYVLVTEKGARVLSKSPKDLTVLPV